MIRPTHIKEINLSREIIKDTYVIFIDETHFVIEAYVKDADKWELVEHTQWRNPFAFFYEATMSIEWYNKEAYREFALEHKGNIGVRIR